MRSFHINSFGGPDSLIIKDSELPKPGRGEVLVRVGGQIHGSTPVI